jgi:hypothetical protein
MAEAMSIRLLDSNNDRLSDYLKVRCYLVSSAVRD